MMTVKRAALLAAVLLAGCGDAAPPRPAPEPAGPGATAAPSTPDAEPRRPKVRRAHCPASLRDNCAAVTGRVIYVEAVDPDGDGDAHYVLAGGRVTAPGITVVDVGPHLRPARLPRVGDVVSAAGPVFTGSYGQRQIEAVEVHHRRR